MMQQNQTKTHSVFLDLHLDSSPISDFNVNTINSSSILQSWSNLRNPSIISQPNLLNSSLQTLTSLSPLSLHLSAPQVTALLSLLSSPSLSSHSLSLISRLLYVYLRKNRKPSPEIVDSLISNLDKLLLCESSYGILLVGALVACRGAKEESCLALLDRLCEMVGKVDISDNGCVRETISALGYGLVSANEMYFERILGFLFGGLRVEFDVLEYGIMVLKMFEWVIMEYAEVKDGYRIELLCREIENWENKGLKYRVLMASFGVLRGFRSRSSISRMKLSVDVANSMEKIVGSIASYTISNGENELEKRLVLQCVPLGLVRCEQLSYIPSVFLCLCLGLLNEVILLRDLLKMVNENGDKKYVLEKVQEQLRGILFKEVGAITRVFCYQYSMADHNHKSIVEQNVWEYAHGLYLDLRKSVFLLHGKNDELFKNLDKIAETTFLMVVVFAAEAAKQKLNSKIMDRFDLEVAVRILVAFSCIEYLRRVRLPEYTEAVRRAVLAVQENEYACNLFVKESLPSYSEITNLRGTFALEGRSYVWWEDQVQTARILFCLRVIPTCINLVSTPLFEKLVAPTMFLYLRHPNEKVARASHAVFVAFISSGKESEQDERMALKEKLVFYYIERSLEAYPGVTPFEGLASGVAAIVRHLPAGSPAIFFCVHSLTEKATDLCSKALMEDATLWSHWEGNSEPYKKVIDLLLRLIALVDIQVFPYLLKQLAEFVVQLPKKGQNVLLGELHTQVAESDDVTRKPLLVSWLQSLSYLCTQKKSTSFRKSENYIDENLKMNRNLARL